MKREELIRRLAEKLTDRELLRIFPEGSPEMIRRILRGEQAEAGVAAAPSGPARNSADRTECSLYTDGASRGNPGLAGAGMVIFNQAGEELLARSAFLGTCTNNVAEYKALIMGLQGALELGCSRLHIHLDSELIVRQLSGRYKVKNATLKPLFAEVRELLRQFKGHSVVHVPRERNKRADELANKGIDER